MKLHTVPVTVEDSIEFIKSLEKNYIVNQLCQFSAYTRIHHPFTEICTYPCVATLLILSRKQNQFAYPTTNEYKLIVKCWTYIQWSFILLLGKTKVESKEVKLDNNIEWGDAGTETKPACSVSPMDLSFNCLILLCTHLEFL